MSHIFVSYSRKDSDFMQQLAQDLTSKEFTLWTDDNLTTGTRGWKLAIEKAIEEAGAVLAILSPDAKESEWVDRELEYARIRDIRIFPVIARGDAITAVPFELVNSQWVDLSNDYNDGFEKLVLVLDKHLGVRRKSRTELIQDELRHLVRKLPGVYWSGVFSADGLPVAFYTPSTKDDHNFAPNEDRIAAMIISTLTLSEHINHELDAGETSYNVIGGSRGFQFGISLGKYVLWFGLRSTVSLDAIFITLKQWWEPLLTLLDVESPPEL